MEATFASGELEIKTSRQGSSTALLLAGGRKPASEWLVQIAASKDIYCADKGIECCCENNLKPVWLCGDADSAAKTAGKSTAFRSKNTSA